MKKLIGFISTLSLLFSIAVVPAFAQNINVKPQIAPNVELGGIISAVINLLFIVAAVVAVVFLIWGGIRWIISGGDKTAVESARNTIIAAIIGLIVVFLAYFVLKFVFQFLGIPFLDTFNVPNANNPNIR